MHILYILDFYKPNKGGIEVLFEQIINYFGKKHKISVITWKYDRNLQDIEKQGNITIYRIKAKNLIFYTLKAYFFAKKIIKNVDIIHTSNFYSAFTASKLAKKYNKKAILHINGFFGNYRFKMIDKLRAYKFKLLEYGNIKGNFTKYIAVSRYMYDVVHFYYGLEHDKIKLIYNGIDYNKWKENVLQDKVRNIKEKYKLENNYSLLFYGRIEKVKGLDILLETIKEFKDIKLLLIVHGNIESLKQKIKKLGIQKQTIIIKGQEHNKIPNFIKAVNAVVFPSLTESFGYVGLETSILGTPLICSNSGAIPEIVFGKVNFFEPHNKNSLIEAIKKTKKGDFTNIPNKNFDIKNTLKEIEKLYDELILN